MVVKSELGTTDPRRARHDAKRDSIVAAAWKLARKEGLAGLSLRALADAVGMRQPSLYSYFTSKMDLYDAMYADGNRALVAALRSCAFSVDPADALKELARLLGEFAQADPVRHEVMNERTIPGFEPSAESYAIAVEFFDFAVSLLRDAGLDSPEELDMYRIITSGINMQQLTNDPAGDTFRRLSDRMIDMLVRDARRARQPRKAKR